MKRQHWELGKRACLKLIHLIPLFCHLSMNSHQRYSMWMKFKSGFLYKSKTNPKMQLNCDNVGTSPQCSVIASKNKDLQLKTLAHKLSDEYF